MGVGLSFHLKVFVTLDGRLEGGLEDLIVVRQEPREASGLEAPGAPIQLFEHANYWLLVVPGSSLSPFALLDRRCLLHLGADRPHVESG